MAEKDDWMWLKIIEMFSVPLQVIVGKEEKGEIAQSDQCIDIQLNEKKFNDIL